MLNDRLDANEVNHLPSALGEKTRHLLRAATLNPFSHSNPDKGSTVAARNTLL